MTGGLDEFLPRSEIVALAMSEDEVEERIGRIKAAVAEVWGDLIALYRARAWVTLGLPSWEALCDERLGMRPKLPVEPRRTAVAEMTQAGMSTRAIGAALDIGLGTVHRDQSATVPNGTVDPSPREVVGQDGRTRTYPTAQAEEALEEFVSNDPGIRAANIRTRFSRWLLHISEHHLFDADEVGRISADRLDDVERIRSKFDAWCDAYVAAASPRPALRVVTGEEQK